MFTSERIATSFGRPDCGNALFSSITALNNFGPEVRAIQRAIEDRRRDLASGVSADDAEYSLRLSLGEIGMDEETIAAHVANPSLEADGFYCCAGDI